MTTQTFLSRKEVAERLGVSSGAFSRVPLPEPDAIIGGVRGWLPATIDAWNESRPGRGNWSRAAREKATR
jgi:predicted DNA-binding transcriptional regulator AlpA